MRIAIVNNFSYVTGGADVHCFDLADLLRERGHEVSFLATAGPSQVVRDGAFVPLRVTNATRDTAPFTTRLQVAGASFWNRAAARAMAELLHRSRPDVVHVHKAYPHLSVSPLRIAARAGVPIVQTVHDYEFVSANAFDASGSWIDHKESQVQYRVLNTALYQLKRRVHVPLVDRWIAVSRSTAGFYRRIGVEAEVLPNFTKVPVASNLDLPARNGILYIGRLTEDKGVRDVIELARALPHESVSIAGYGALDDVVRQAAATLPNLEYLGSLPQAEVQAVLRQHRVCVMPSRWQEPGPLACLEAMAAGTPVVAYDNGGLADYVSDAAAGIVVREDVAALVDACRQLAVDDARWTRDATNAIEAIQEVHSPETYVTRLLGVYAAAVQSGRRSTSEPPTPTRSGSDREDSCPHL